MNQTIEEMVYVKRVESSITSWNEQDKKFATKGNIIGKNGTSFYINEEGKLCQRLDEATKGLVKAIKKRMPEFCTANSLEVESPSASTIEAAELVR